jgi:hypothetical protein
MNPFIQEAIKVLEQSSARVRNTLLLAAVASVVMFATTWNARQESWMAYRFQAYHRAANALALCCPLPKKGCPSPIQCPSDVQLAASLYQSSALKTHEWLLEAYQVRVPFFDVALDVNDVGPIGSAAFVIIGMLFRYGMQQQLRTVRFIVQEARARHCMSETYALITLTQVLRIPHTKYDSLSPHFLRLERHAPKLLAILPPVVLIRQLSIDISTVDNFVKMNAPTWLFGLETIAAGAAIAFFATAVHSAFTMDEELDSAWHVAEEEESQRAKIVASSGPQERASGHSLESGEQTAARSDAQVVVASPPSDGKDKDKDEASLPPTQPASGPSGGSSGVADRPSTTS